MTGATMTEARAPRPVTIRVLHLDGAPVTLEAFARLPALAVTASTDRERLEWAERGPDGRTRRHDWAAGLVLGHVNVHDESCPGTAHHHLVVLLDGQVWKATVDVDPGAALGRGAVGDALLDAWRTHVWPHTHYTRQLFIDV